MPESKHISTQTSADNIIYNLEYEQALQEAGLLGFDRVMAITETRTVKHAVIQRRTGTFSFKNKSGQFHLKLVSHGLFPIQLPSPNFPPKLIDGLARLILFSSSNFIERSVSLM